MLASDMYVVLYTKELPENIEVIIVLGFVSWKWINNSQLSVLFCTTSESIWNIPYRAAIFVMIQTSIALFTKSYEILFILNPTSCELNLIRPPHLCVLDNSIVARMIINASGYPFVYNMFASDRLQFPTAVHKNVIGMYISRTKQMSLQI